MLEAKMLNVTAPSQSKTVATTKFVYVLSEIDGFKYKLVMEGDVRLLTVAKVKRYLQNATGLSPKHQVLSFNGKIVQDGDCGDDLGLSDGAIFRLQHVNTVHQAHNSNEGLRKLSDRSSSVNTAYDHRKSTSTRAMSSSLSTAGRASSDHGGQSRGAHDIAGISLGSSQADTDHYNGHSRDLNSELSLENARLRERLSELERQLINACSDWRLHEEIEELKGTVTQLQKEKDNAERVAEAKWYAKEEELVKELDILREERRRLRREQAFFEEEQLALVRRLEEQICVQSKMSVRPEEVLLLGQRGEPSSGRRTFLETVEKSLGNLSSELGIPPLKLDENDTCVVPLDDGANVLVTLDPGTERLFMYATIANALPSSAEARLQLFQLLLEGALLGRDMAGGGVGICTRNNLIIMDVCVDIAHADEYALASIAKPFMSSVKRWIKVVQDVVSQMA